MKKSNHLILLAISSILVVHCSKKQPPATAATPASNETTASNSNADTPLTVPGDTSGISPSSISIPVIYFDYDQSTLNAEARNILQQSAASLKSGNWRLTIDGHCDERGSNEYNLALGESRARAVRDYLKKLGVSSAQINISSSGEEKPADLGQGDGAWAKNRRAEITVNN